MVLQQDPEALAFFQAAKASRASAGGAAKQRAPKQRPFQ